MLIKVKVFTKAKKQKILEEENKEEENKNSIKDNSGQSSFTYAFEVYVKAKPEQGKANQESLTLLASYFKTPFKNLKIIRGHKCPNKIIKVSP